MLFIYCQRWVPGRTFEAIGSLGGLMLASVVTAKGYEGYCFAGIVPKVVRLLEERKDRLYAVCFYCDFDNRDAVSAVLSRFRDAPFYKLVGGPHTMHIGRKDAAAFHADAILCGDGEESVPAWLDSHQTTSGEAVPLKEETTPERQGTYTLLSSFSTYPYPDDSRDLGFRTGLFSVISARGCPHRCAFCFEGGNSKLLRPRAVEEVLEEIRLRLAGAPRLNYLFFADDTLTYDPDRLELLCEGLKKIRRERAFVWFCEGHAHFFRRHPQTLALMVEAGMVRMQIGMESGCQEILDMYGKKISTEDIRYTARLAWEAGLPQLAGNFIIGGAGETPATARKTSAFVQSLLEEFPGLLDISTTFPIPLSGTSLTEEPGKYGIQWLDREFVTSLEDVPVNRTDTMGVDEICRARADFLRQVLWKMKTLAAEGKIPRERMIRSLTLNLRYGIADNWTTYIFKRDSWCVRYVDGLTRYGLHTWDQVKREDAQTLIPVTVPPRPELGARELSRDALSLLLAARGQTLAQLGTQLGYSPQVLRRAAAEADGAWGMLFARI